MEEQGEPSGYTNGEEFSTAQNEAQKNSGGGKCPCLGIQSHKLGGARGPGFLLSVS